MDPGRISFKVVALAAPYDPFARAVSFAPSNTYRIVPRTHAALTAIPLHITGASQGEWTAASREAPAARGALEVVADVLQNTERDTHAMRMRRQA